MPDDVLSLHCIVVEFKSVDTLAILNLATPNSSENCDVTPLGFNSSSREPFKSQVTPVGSDPPEVEQVKAVVEPTATTFRDGASVAIDV